MRVFLAGGSGVLGLGLIPLLVEGGDEVAAMTRTAGKLGLLESLGATPVLCDVFDLDALRAVVAGFGPDAVMHQLTDLPDDASRIAEFWASNARIRREGTRNLLDAARGVGASRFVAQSVSWELPGDAGASIRDHERAVLDAGGVVVRYGQLYGPGTYYEADKPAPPRVQVTEAARRTIPTIKAPAGTIVVIDEAAEPGD